MSTCQGAPLRAACAAVAICFSGVAFGADVSRPIVAKAMKGAGNTLYEYDMLTPDRSLG